MLTVLRRSALLTILALLPAAATARAATDPTGPGALDRTYGHDGLVRSSLGQGAEAEMPLLTSSVRSDGRVVVATQSRRLARFTAGGALDRGFGFGGTFFPDFSGDGNDSVRDMAVGPDGRIVLVGTSRADQVTVLRLTADGKIDTTFNHGSAVVIPTGGYVYGYRSGGEAVTVAPDGGVLLAYTVSPYYSYISGDKSIPRTVVDPCCPPL